jgi:hypothetical protein
LLATISTLTCCAIIPLEAISNAFIFPVPILKLVSPYPIIFWI